MSASKVTAPASKIAGRFSPAFAKRFQEQQKNRSYYRNFMAVGGIMLWGPPAYILFGPTVVKVFFPPSEDHPTQGKNGSSYVADLRQARRSSLKEFQAAYFEGTTDVDKLPVTYAPHTYDRFNKNLRNTPEESMNPNRKKSMGRKKSSRKIGLYDSEGLADKSRTTEGNQWLKQRTQSMTQVKAGHVEGAAVKAESLD